MQKDQRRAQSSQLAGVLILTGASVIWGIAFAFQRMGMDDIGPFTFSASRMWLAAAAVGLVRLLMGRLAPASKDGRSVEAAAEKRRITLRGGLVCGLFLSIATNFQQVGLQYTTAGKAGFLTAFYMLLVPVLAIVLFGRKSSLQIWICVALGLLGMYLLSIRGGFTLSRGDGLVLVCALVFSAQILSCDYFAKRGADLVAVSCLQLAVTAAVSTVLAFVFETPAWAGIRSAAVPILYCGIASGGMGYTLQIVGQKRCDAAVAGMVMSLESVFSALFGAVLLHERMTARELAGCAVLFAAIILVQIPVSKRRDHGR